MNPLESIGDAAMLSSVLPTNGTLNATILAMSFAYQPLKLAKDGWIYAANRVWNVMARAVLGGADGVVDGTDLDDGRNMFSLFTYLSSPYSLLVFVMAILLNRTLLYAAVRQPYQISTAKRVAVRLPAIYFLVRSLMLMLSLMRHKSTLAADWLPASLSSERDDDPKVMWTVFKTLCFSNFIEFFSAALQRRHPTVIFSMSTGEYSWAFWEAQTFWELTKNLPSTETFVTTIIWTLGALSVHILALFNLDKYRLYASTLWGASFLGFYGYSVAAGRLLEFPTFCAMWFVPHLLVGIVVVASLLVTLFARLTLAPNNPENLMRNNPFMDGSWRRILEMNTSDDFFVLLLKAGDVLLQDAHEATYMNEEEGITMPDMTYLEQMLQKGNNKKERLPKVPTESTGLQIERTDLDANATALIQDMKQRQPKRFKKSRAAWTLMKRMWYLFLGLFRRGWRPQPKPKDESLQNAMVRWDWNAAPGTRDPEDEEDEVYEKFKGGWYFAEEEDMDYIPTDDEGEWASDINSDAEGEEQDAFHELVPDARSLADIIRGGDSADAVGGGESSSVLVSHLSSPGVLTRSRHRHTHPHQSSNSDDAAILLSIIRERRILQPAEPTEGRLCVVCQASPREIVLWPCRCLALCDECRVSLAMQKFKGCPCCRKNVVSFSKLYTP
ncbi:hypothetical protein YB2330_001111 [Saitoella coloradoensis]